MKLKAPRIYPVILLVLTGLTVSFYAGRTAYAYHPFGSKMLEVAMTGNVGGFFDDNITYAKSSKKSDWVTDLVAGLRATYTGKKHYLDLIANDREQLYSRYSEFTNNSQDVRLDYRYDRTKYDRIGLKSSFRHYYSPEEFSDAFGRTNGQYAYTTSETDMTYTRDVSQRLSLTATAGMGINILDKKAGDNSSEIRAGASGVYSLSTKWSLLGAYDFSARKFKNGPSSTMHTITGGTRFYFTDRLFWEGVGGLQIADNFSHQIKLAPYIQTSLNGQIDKKTTGKILFSEYSEATSYSQNMFNQWRASADLTRVLWKRLSAFVIAFYGRGEYKTINQKNDLLGANGGLTYDFNEHFKAVAGYSFSMNSSNVNSNEYTKNVATAKIVFTF